MNRADLYVRVSTDEQADKGYSQRDQEERLRKYCINHAILIRNIIYEDHSAKTFSRPQWKRLLLNLKKNKNKVDILLFTKWDRFSRNTGDAYQMITTLRKLGVEPPIYRTAAGPERSGKQNDAGLLPCHTRSGERPQGTERDLRYAQGKKRRSLHGQGASRLHQPVPQ